MVQAGDRIQLRSTGDPYTHLKPGDQGTVLYVRQVDLGMAYTDIAIEWDSGSTLSLIPEAGDRFTVL